MSRASKSLGAVTRVPECEVVKRKLGPSRSAPRAATRWPLCGRRVGRVLKLTLTSETGW